MPSGAFAERRDQDLRKLRTISDESDGKIKIISVSGDPVCSIDIELRYKTAQSARYPEEVAISTRVNINLSTRYPLQEPVATIKTKVFHPNVYESGQICFGTKWLPSEGLDLLIEGIIKIITFDPHILNEASPANGSALSWYSGALRKYPNSFPTERIVFGNQDKRKTMTWKDADTIKNEKILVECPECSAKLRVPSARSGTIRCPRCSHAFEATT